MKWKRLHGETERDYQLFLSYLDLGPDRNLRTLAKQSKVSEEELTELAQKWKWTERAQAWDEEKIQNLRRRREMTREELLVRCFDLLDMWLLRLERAIASELWQDSQDLKVFALLADKILLITRAVMTPETSHASKTSPDKLLEFLRKMEEEHEGISETQ